MTTPIYPCPGLCSPDFSGFAIQPTIPYGSPYLMIIGEAPGQQESQMRTFFVGKAGQELSNYLRRASIPRDRCYITNVLKCTPPGNRDPKEEEIRACSTILLAELDAVRPQFIATVGKFATQFFLGDVTMEMTHGIPFRVTHPVSAIVIPVYHPSAGLHDTTNMSNIMSDFLAVRDVMGGKIEPRNLGQYVQPPPYHLVEKGEDITPYLGDLVALDTETEDERDTPWCVQFCSFGEQGHVVMADNTPALTQLSCHLSDPQILSIIHNSLFDLGVLDAMGVRPVSFTDTMIMAYLLQTEPQGLKPLTFRHLGVKMDEYEDIVNPRTLEMAIEYLIQASTYEWGKCEPVLEMKAGKPKIRQPQPINQKIKRILNDLAKGKEVDVLDRWTKTPLAEGRGVVEAVLGPMRRAYLKDVDQPTAMQYAATDPWATYHIYHVLKKRIDDMWLDGVLDRDNGVVHMVARMQATGFPVYPPYFRELGQEFQTEMDAVVQVIHSMVGDLHPGSDPQVRELLIKLGVITPKYRRINGKQTLITKKTVDAAALELVKDKHPVVPKIMRYRELAKLQDSFVHTLLKKTDDQNRVHTKLRITRVVTGRLSSSNPNLMAIPTRTKDGRRIRGGFRAPKGYVIMSNDYAQVEMRVVAHISADPNMMEVFITDADLHSYTAAGMFKIPMDQVDEMKHRYPAKRVGFGILNLISAQKLLKEFTVGGVDIDALGWNEETCQDMINDWFRLYYKIADYVEERKAEARRTGMVRDMFGRVRLVPEVISVHKNIVEAGIRQAVNAPIQMGAQGVIKEAMRQLGPICRDIGYDIIDPLIQIHDDLEFLVREDALSWVAPIIKHTMENCVSLLVPLKVDSKVGVVWNEMEKYKV